MTIKTPQHPAYKPQTVYKEAEPVIDGIKLNLYDNRTVSMGSIATAVEGYPFTVDYFNQMITKDQEPDGHNNSVYQQYQKIEGLKIKLNSPFDYSMSTSDGYSSVTGQAKTFAPGLIPIVGDVFTASIGNGRTGKFTVSEVETLSMYHETIYQFSFKLMSILSLSALASLNKQVVKRLVYVQDFLLNGKSPLLTEKEYNDHLLIQRSIKTITSLFAKQMYSRGMFTLVVPSQPLPLYDPYVTKFITRMIPQEAKLDSISNIGVLNVDHHDYDEFIDVYEVILKQDVELLSSCFRKAAQVSTRHWTNNRREASIYYSGFNKIVFPLDIAVGVDAQYGALRQLDKDSSISIEDTTLTYQDVRLLPLLQEDDYVFTDGFYDQDMTQPMSHIEMQVLDYLNDRDLSSTVLLELIRTYRQWTPTAQFYYGPVLIALLIAGEYSA